MKYYRFIFVVGVWTVMVPFLGITMTAKKVLLIIPAVLLMFVGIMMSQEAHHRDNTGLSYEERNPRLDDHAHEILEPIAQDQPSQTEPTDDEDPYYNHTRDGV